MTALRESGLGQLDPAGEQHAVPMRDGVRLHADLYRPTAAEEPTPAVLIRLPYGTARGYTYMPQVSQYLARHGYHVLVQDVRGRFRSEGERTPCVHEPRDGWDTLEWMVAQPWCDGAIGMLGTSYYGFTQWAASSTRHPALKAIIPRYTSQLIPPRTSFTREGVSWLPDALSWIAGIWSVESMLDRDPVGLDLNARPLADALPPVLRNARRIVAERLALGEDGFARTVYPDGDPAARLAIPALHVAGWWDNTKRVQFPDWALASTVAPAAAEQYLVVDATDHRDQLFSLDGGSPGAYLHGDDEALAAYLPRMLDLPLSFLDHYLRGGEGPWPGPRVRYTLTNAGKRTAERWPPRPAGELVLHLADADGAVGPSVEGGRLTPEPAPETVADWVHDPLDPVPSLAADDFEICAGLPDESEAHSRDDVATFTGPPLEEALDVVGTVRATLTLAADAPHSDLIATLCDVQPDGRALMVVEGAARVLTDAAAPARAEVDLSETAYRFLPGHRLRLAIASSRFPRYTVHPGNDVDIWTSAERRSAAQRLHVGGEHTALLRLPLGPPDA